MSKIKVSVVARITKEPETKFIPSGKSITKINMVADSCTKKDGGGFEPIWITAALWGKEDGSTPGVVNYLTKGSQVFVTGDLNIRNWEAGGKSGIEYSIERPEFTLVGAKVEKPAVAEGGTEDTEDPFAGDL